MSQPQMNRLPATSIVKLVKCTFLSFSGIGRGSRCEERESEPGGWMETPFTVLKDVFAVYSFGCMYSDVYIYIYMYFALVHLYKIDHALRKKLRECICHVPIVCESVAAEILCHHDLVHVCSSDVFE